MSAEEYTADFTTNYISTPVIVRCDWDNYYQPKP